MAATNINVNTNNKRIIKKLADELFNFDFGFVLKTSSFGLYALIIEKLIGSIE